MATYYGLGADEPLEDSERRVASSLKQLPAEYIVLHHVSWQSRRNGRQGDGEADFIIIHPQRGIVVLEVKGGGVEIENGRWASIDRFGKKNSIKNPYEQALASKYALLEWLERDALVSNIRVGHAVAFPHMQTLPHLGLTAPEAITWSQENLKNPLHCVERVSSHWQLKSNLATQDLSKLVRLLAPTVSMRRSLASKSAAAEDDLLEFTAGQVEAFSRLRAARGGLVIGTAGTGKTVLAIARAHKLSIDGFRTLLVCYNELLGASLSERFARQDNLTASTYHSLCFREAAKAGLPIPQNPTQAWWDNDAADLLIEACAINESEFDAIIIDEGQDFSPKWIESLRCLVSSRPDAPFFLFADPHQEMWKRDWAKDSSWPFVYELRDNLRNTIPIAQRVAAVLDLEWPTRGVTGPEPAWRDIQNTSRPETDVVSALERLIDDGFGPQNLVVLCASAAAATRLREEIVGSYSLGKWGGNGIAVETIARFKGMESEAIVVLLDDSGQPNELTSAYVGISRARSVLTVVGSGRHQKGLKWLHSPSVVTSK